MLIELRRSRWLEGLYTTGVGAVLVSIWLAPASPRACAGLSLVAGFWAVTEGLRSRRERPNALWLGADGAWSLCARGRWWPLQIETVTCTHPLLVIARVRFAGGLRWLTVPADALAADAHRRLRRRLAEERPP